MLVYLDEDFKCHVGNDGTMRAFDVPDFDGKCKEYIEGHRYVPEGETWVRPDGEKFSSMLSPWKNSVELDRLQAEYEHELLEQLRAELADADAALNELGVEIDGQTT